MIKGRYSAARAFRYFSVALAGVVAGAINMSIGAFLASGDNRWAYALHHSAAGIVGAPLAALVWATHRYWRAKVFGGVSVLIGFVSAMTMMFELTEENSALKPAANESAFALSDWFVSWALGCRWR